MNKTALKVTQASLNQTALDWSQNISNHYTAIDIAVAEGSDIVLMPELSLTGYEVNDDFQRTDNNRIYEALANIAAYANTLDPDLIVSVGNPWRLQLRDVFEQSTKANPDFVHNGLYDRWNRPFNVQTLLSNGNIISMTAKANLYISERGYENRYFNQWSFRNVEEYARLAGMNAPYGTVPIILPNGQRIPFGRPLVYITDSDGSCYIHATAICEEKWVATKYDSYPNDDSRYEQLNIIPSISRYLGTKDGLFLEVSNASPPSREKQDKHMHLNGLASQWANVVVDTDGLGTSGATFAQFGHRLIAQDGKTIVAGKRMGFGQIETTTSVVQIQNANPVLEKKAHVTVVRKFKDRNADSYAKIVFETQEDQKWDDPRNSDRWKEERIRNQALWMFDYMRKAGSSRIVEALSGGQDSSFNTVMIRVMIELAMHDLGVNGFCEQMAHLPYIDKIMEANVTGGKNASVKTCMNEMLVAVYMGTDNSSHETWYAAKSLIDGGDLESGGTFEGIGGQFLERNIQDLVTATAFIYGTKKSTEMSWDEKRDALEELADFVHASPHKYTPEYMIEWAQRITEKYPKILELTSAALPKQGIAYENFQARLREVLIMAFANVKGGMAVANPNLDEAYGAYATFGGDLHSGTVNPNSGLHKADEQALLKYLEEHGVHGVMNRIIALAPTNGNPPTAELQPKKDGEVVQFDEDALQGTFPQKTALSRLRHHTKIYAEGGERWMNASELFFKTREDLLFTNLDDNQLFNAVVYFYQRWEGPAQHKIHATPIAPTFGENVDKQTSLRTSNLSGGSRDEIVKLGIDLLFQWAKEDGLNWNEETYRILCARSWQDKVFISEFHSRIWNCDVSLQNTNYNLRGLYDQLQKSNWDELFRPLQDNHPIRVIQNALLTFGHRNP